MLTRAKRFFVPLLALLLAFSSPAALDKRENRNVRFAMAPAGQGAVSGTVRATPAAVPLPPGVNAVWDLHKAHRQTTSTRERLCLNGLWRWQPARDTADAVPQGHWGYFKAPGFWPGNANYAQEDCQTLYAHPSWKDTDLRRVTAAWYEREITVPRQWTGRRIALSLEYLNSFAVVYVDGKKVAVMRFPSGEADLTAACRPGTKHVLSLLVVALPLKGVLLSYSDTNSAREVPGAVDRRGLCGDVYLTSTPPAARIADVKLATSVRRGEATLTATLDGLAADVSYALRVSIRDNGRGVREFTSKAFKASDLKDGHVAVTEKWKPEKLWDLHTPQNLADAEVRLVTAGDELRDVYYPVRFGFREFWIDGRDFYLNGTRIYLSAVPLDNAQLGARAASYEGARETLKRLQSFGINFVYTHNYGCQPGSHVSFAEVLRAADDVGMLVALSQPHFGHYDWKGADADRANGYAPHAAFYVRVAQNHPSVVAYSMSHNATGYDEDMNPDLIDGIHDPRKDTWSQNNARLALRAEAIVKHLDSERVVYHHSSGNLGSMHTSNFYLNFVPIQEVSDWFEHWSKAGVKPMFPVEYGVPFSWDWTMYRGWYKGVRTFGSARVPWEFCLAEWNAQFVGDRAYKISEREKQNLRFEAKRFKAGNLWHRWDYPHHVGSRDFDERAEIFAHYLSDNWRAFRTLGLSANSPWEHAIYWNLKDGANTGRRDFTADWDTLQKPGFSADYTQRQSWQMVTDFKASDWVPTAAAQALYRNNRPLLAYIGGKAGAVTSKDHNFWPGETVEKQLVIINNSRETATCDCSWQVSLPSKTSGSARRTIRTGDQGRIPLHIDLPPNLPAGRYEIAAVVEFSTGERQTDSFTFDVLLPPAGVAVKGKVALLDPRGETAKLLKGMKVPFQAVDANTDLAGHDLLIIGRGALTPDGPGPNVRRVRDGLKVVVFEQDAKTLEQRFGFRVAEYGLREVFPRVPDHPILSGLSAEHLHDWRGDATLLPPRLQYTLRPRYGPTVKWCGIEVPRAWRCGCRGNVASVLIEKPARGDFLSILDGGYALQYSPLLEYHEGRGLVLFCQLDLTGRSEADPAADALARSILRYVSTWQAPQSRKALYVGEAAGKQHLQAAGFAVGDYTKDALTPACVLIVGPDGGKQLAGDAAAIDAWLKSGGRVLALGLDETNARAFLPVRVMMKAQEYISTHFDAPGMKSLMVGVGPGDLHNRDPRALPLVTGGASIIGNGVLAHSADGNVVLCQIVPWHFDPTKQMNLKRTFRRTACAVTRLATNLGAASEVPILGRFHLPVAGGEARWLRGLYLDTPGEWDDPYRFFRW
jgi:hypothetical protein